MGDDRFQHLQRHLGGPCRRDKNHPSYKPKSHRLRHILAQKYSSGNASICKRTPSRLTRTRSATGIGRRLRRNLATPTAPATRRLPKHITPPNQAARPYGRAASIPRGLLASSISSTGTERRLSDPRELADISGSDNEMRSRSTVSHANVAMGNAAIATSAARETHIASTSAGYGKA